MSSDAFEPVVGILGGTGPQGLGLARRFSDGGLRVVIGSRSPERAQAAAESLGDEVVGSDNATCAEQGDIIVVAVPYDGHAELLRGLRVQLARKVVVDCVNPLGFDGKGPYALEVPEGSACEQAQACLPESVVTGAFHHLSAVHLADPERAEIDCDVLVLGDDRDAVEATARLAERIAGARGVFGGRLRNAHQVEAFTANLIAMNRRYKAHAGLRITDV